LPRGPAASGRQQATSLALPRCRPAAPTIPAYAFELGVIIQDGIKRMYGTREEGFYYITVMNEQYEMPAMPERAPREAFIKGSVQIPRTRRTGAKRARSSSGAARF
jgi:pyruvate dehydrogenase E1 component